MFSLKLLISVICLLCGICFSSVVTNTSGHECKPVSTQLCQALNYNTTVFPNTLNQTQQEAASAIQQLSPIVSIKCSDDLTFLLCSLYEPICTATRKPLPPCRSVCKRVRAGCERLMNNFGITWPSSLACEKLPQANSEQACAQPSRDANMTVPVVMPTNPPTRQIVHTTRYHCEPVTTPLCRGFNYSMSVFPNILNQTKQEAASTIQKLLPVVNLKCSNDLEFLLCSVYEPICTAARKPLPPCRSVCEKVRTGCESVLRGFGVTWPESLACEQLPRVDSDQVCVRGVHRTIHIVTPPIATQQTQTTNTFNTPPTIGIKTSIGTHKPCDPVKSPLCRGLKYSTAVSPTTVDQNQQQLGGTLRGGTGVTSPFLWTILFSYLCFFAIHY